MQEKEAYFIVEVGREIDFTLRAQGIVFVV
jgi:hypothetical protein